MADSIVKISALPLASALTGSEYIPIVQAGVTRRATAAQIQASPEVANITGGTIDNATIGATTPSTGRFTYVSINNANTTSPQLTIGNETPPAWTSAFRAINIDLGGALWTSHNSNIIQLSSNLHFNGNFRLVSDGAACLFSVNTDKFIWNTSTTGLAGSVVSVDEVMRLTQTGNLLVGTPVDDGANRLQVVGTAIVSGNTTVPNLLLSSGIVRLTTALAADNGELDIAGSGAFDSSRGAAMSLRGINHPTRPGYLDLYSGTSAPMTFIQGATERARFSVTNGNLLIATATDAASTYPLQIQKDQNAVTGIRLKNGTAGTLAGAQIDTINNTGKLMSVGINSTSYTTSGQFVADQGWLYTNGTAGMLISTSSTTAPIVFNQQATERMRIAVTTGNVLIGTATDAGATYKLQVVNAGTAIAKVENTTASIATYLGADASASFIGSQTNHPFVFATNATEKMRLDTSGNLGIGRTPSVKLDVNAAMVNITSANIINETAETLRLTFADPGTVAAGDGTSIKIGMVDRGNVVLAQAFNTTSKDVPEFQVWSGSDGTSYTKTMSVAVGTVVALQGANLTAGCGIAFPATQVASSDANTLDDYEEGTFTPTLTFGGAQVGMTFAFTPVGFYTKIGNVVNFTLYVSLTAKGSSVGNAFVTGLPFTTNGTANKYVSCVGTMSNMAAGIASEPGIQIAPSTIQCILAKFAAGTASNFNDTDFTNTSAVIISGTYYV